MLNYGLLCYHFPTKMTHATLHSRCCLFPCFSCTTHDHLAVTANNLKWFILQNVTHTSCALCPRCWFSSAPTFFFFSFFADIPEIPESIKFCRALEIADFSGNPLSRWETDHNCVHHYCSAEKLKCSSSWSFLILLFSHMTHTVYFVAQHTNCLHFISIQFFFRSRVRADHKHIPGCPRDF